MENVASKMADAQFQQSQHRNSQHHKIRGFVILLKFNTENEEKERVEREEKECEDLPTSEYNNRIQQSICSYSQLFPFFSPASSDQPDRFSITQQSPSYL